MSRRKRRQDARPQPLPRRRNKLLLALAALLLAAWLSFLAFLAFRAQ